MMDGDLTRRDFLKRSSAAALAIGAGLPLFAQGGARKTKVVLIRHKDVLESGGKLRPEVLEDMLDEGVTKLFDVRHAGEAWKLVAGPSDTVGIKTNVWKYLRTPPELEKGLSARLVVAGVPEEKIGIDDRGIRTNPLFTGATVLVNVRPMRAHHWSGVGGCLKNYIMFTESPPDYHPDSCVDLGALWNLPAVKGKTRLNILLMLTPQFNCLGPHHFDPEFVWPYGGMLLGVDPVAVDAVGLRIIEAKRKLFFPEDSPLRPSAKHIRAAEEKHRIGVADPAKIDLVRIGWEEGILI
jgi:hypothetical protein